ncbi:MAG: hypothetical protein IT290_09425 [Deltaproteobacteria bacterium]|nr:hypothetical protein [Deltaproteobacteria bacterium]
MTRMKGNVAQQISRVSRSNGSQAVRNDVALVPSDEIRIHPVNTDNQQEFEHVFQLVSASGGAGLGNAVYDLEYLRKQMHDLESDERLVSLCAMIGEDCIAHVALHFSGRSSQPELILPVLDRSHAEFAQSISDALRSKIERIAERQEWSAVLQFISTRASTLEIFPANSFDAVDLAIIPEPELGAQRNGRKHSIMNAILLRAFVCGTLTESPRFIHPPKHHMAKVGELFSKLSQNRVVVDTSTRKSNGNAQNVTKAKKTAETVSRRFGGITQISVNPEGAECQSLVAMLEERAAQAQVEFEPLIVRVSLASELCANACTLLENRGFRFCGVMPGSETNDWILYSKFDPSALNGMQFATPQSKSLLQYMQSYRTE